MTEPWWISLIKAFLIINLLLLTFAYTTLIERKAMARMQLRYGPNRAGPYGVLQPIADLVKLVRKEAFEPIYGNRAIYIAAPILSAFTALAGKKLSLRTSFTRSAIGCRRPNGPARFGP